MNEEYKVLVFHSGDQAKKQLETHLNDGWSLHTLVGSGYGHDGWIAVLVKRDPVVVK